MPFSCLRHFVLARHPSDQPPRSPPYDNRTYPPLSYVRTHIGDEDHELPPNSPYRHNFPKLEEAMASTKFLGTSYQSVTPVETFGARLADVVLSKSPPR